jgi:hypothetical protein
MLLFERHRQALQRDGDSAATAPMLDDCRAVTDANEPGTSVSVHDGLIRLKGTGRPESQLQEFRARDRVQAERVHARTVRQDSHTSFFPSVRARIFRAGWPRRAVHSGEEPTRQRVYSGWMGSGRRGTARQPDRPGAVPDPVILELRFRPPGDHAASKSGDAARGDVAAAEVARRLNASIYKAGESLADERDKEFELTFFCACGCMEEVKRSLQEYVTRGAVVEGHSRPAGLDPQLGPSAD